MRIFEAKGIDQQAYISFISEYKMIMYHIAYGYFRDETKALDAVDEAVYLGYLHRKDLREPQHLKTWLTRILMNECHRILRRNHREVITEEVPEKAYDPDDVSLSLKQAVQELPEDLKKVIVLRYFGGYSIADTSDILGIPAGTVSTRTRKALNILRVEISEEEGGISNERLQTELG